MSKRWRSNSSKILKSLAHKKKQIESESKLINLDETLKRKKIIAKSSLSSRCSVNFTSPLNWGGGGSIFKKNLKINPLILRKFSIIFVIQLSADFCLLQYLRFYLLELLITRTIYVYIANVLSFLNIRWLTVKVNLVLDLKAVKKIARLSNQSSLI